MSEQRTVYATSKDADRLRKIPCRFAADARETGRTDAQNGTPYSALCCNCEECREAYAAGVRDRLAAQR